MRYLDDLVHSELGEHYTEGGYGAYFLTFSQEYQERCLPKQGENGFICTLLDTTNQKTYSFPIYAAYEPNYNLVFDVEGNEITNLRRLQFYFYESHYCPCHRKTDAKRAGAKTDDECNGNRFRIEKITPINSNLILMSETYNLEKLEGMLSNEQ